MFTFQSNSCEFLYHYTKAETAIDYILSSGTLKFSSYRNTNDPKESKDWFFIPGTNENRDLSKYTPEYLTDIMNPRLKLATNLLCFSIDQSLTGNHLEDTPKRGFCKPRMWAQYADNHKGICLVFNSETLSKEIHKNFNRLTYISDHIQYKDRLIADIQTEQAFIVNIDCLENWGADEYAYGHGQKFAKRLFFEKALDWSNEDEYRWVVFDCENELLLEYKNALRGIVFGANCSDDTISKIVNLTKNQALQYQQLKWRNCTPWFDFGRTKWL